MSPTTFLPHSLVFCLPWKCLARRTLAPFGTSTSWSNSVPWSARDGYIDRPIHLTCDEICESKVETQFSYRCKHLKWFRSSTHRSAQVFKIRELVQSSEGNEALLALAFVLGHASFLPICRRWIWTWRPIWSGNCVLWLGQPTRARRRPWPQLWNRSRLPKQCWNCGPEESLGASVGECFSRCRGGTGKKKRDGRWDGREDQPLLSHHFRHCASYLFHHRSIGFPVPAQEPATRTNAASAAGLLCLWTLWWLWPSGCPNLLVQHLLSYCPLGCECQFSKGELSWLGFLAITAANGSADMPPLDLFHLRPAELWRLQPVGLRHVCPEPTQDSSGLRIANMDLW